MIRNPEIDTDKEVPFKQLLIIDFDRTLGDVDASMQCLYAASDVVGITTQQIKVAQKQTEDDGGSFEPLSHIYRLLSESERSIFKKTFIQLGRETILYEDAQTFLEVIKFLPHCVLTYGVSRDWQELKIQASGYTGPYKIVNTTSKGAIITSWQSPDSLYHLQQPDGTTVKAQSVCLIDDKPIAFSGLPAGAIGFLIQRHSNLLPSQRGELPPGVSIINSLSEIEFKNFSYFSRVNRSA